MPEYTLEVEGRRIGVWFSPWNGRERVTYDGRVVSQRRSFRFKSRHAFAVADEQGASDYEVELGFPSGIVVRRDGLVIAQDRSLVRRLKVIAGVSFVLGLLSGALAGFLS
jgi:hypothetical protein